MKVNLGKTRAEIDLEHRKLFVGDKIIEAEVRSFDQLKDVAMEPEKVPTGIAYYMFRGVEVIEDLRFDVTVIPPALMGKEFVKTYGHFHPKANGLSYPEVYQVIDGKAVLLLQDEDAQEFVAVLADRGDIVFIPPDYGHVTVNVGNDPLILSNVVYSGFSSNYEKVREKRGFAYYLTTEGFIENKNYSNHPSITFMRSAIPRTDLFSLFLERPKVFDFLRKPHKIMWDKVRLFEEGTWSPETLLR